jgi:hypothetical protein
MDQCKEQCPLCKQYFHCVSSHWSSPYARGCCNYHLILLHRCGSCRQPPIHLQSVDDVPTDCHSVRSSHPNDHIHRRPSTPDSLAALLDRPSDVSQTLSNDDNIHPTAGHVYRNVSTTWQLQHLKERDPSNIYFPFTDENEWGVVSWVVNARLTKQDIADFLHLKYVGMLLYSF